MDKIKIEYIFSAGYRCHSPDALNFYGLRKFSGPFDFMYIDLETVFNLVQTNMKDFMTDIVLFNKHRNILERHYTRNTSYTNDRFDDLGNKVLCYMAHDYNDSNLVINQNYLDESLSGNLYDWEKICIFHHHNICDSSVYNVILRRVERFKDIIVHNSKKTCLFHMTKILTIDNITDYMNNIICMKKKYAIETYLIIVICCDNLSDASYYKDDVLFIIKNVEPYTVQFVKYTADAISNYDNEFIVMNQYFDFDILDKERYIRTKCA